MVGRAVHQAVLDAGDTETGVTIHEVIPELDAGPIVAQARVPVLPGDDADTLAARVLVEEHRLLVATLRQVME
jgi:phosphoribosylglycinamide formyltransferase-1